ncbi:MAG: pyridine nucleotide-disulfide oxidoreductase [Firmicutes bacterium HGW-Firmicutes-8]|nr:MAG: pyridine nucleotide-disulfide oxidoreductase [Firmicutes bacterium HGW-Firmicutes-8]
MTMFKINIDGKEIEAPKGSNLLEVARQNGIDIPTLCHDPRLEPFGSCRLCLVEVDGARGPVQSCGTTVFDGMVVKTNTEKTQALRRTALELLLAEHNGDCLAPCQMTCPAHIDIQGFVALIANDQVKEANKLIKETLPLPGSVGRVCPRFCEKECRRQLVDEPIQICWLKRYAGDNDLVDGEPFVPQPKPDTGKKIAVIGGGPAGLSAAYYLALEGHQITIFEARGGLGGFTRYGIPEYRLPKAELDKEIKLITDLCKDVQLNKTLGQDFTIDSLKEQGFDAIFIGIGAWSNTKLKVEGEDMEGVTSGIEFLEKVTDDKNIAVPARVAVIGGGNTAMDACRTAVRLGSKEVSCIYRRSRSEMPANPHEVHQAEEEGVKFELLTAPVGFVGENGKATGIKCVKMVLGEPDASGRRRPVPVEGSDFVVAADMVILAVGQSPDVSGLGDKVGLNRWKCVDVNPKTMQTHVPGVFSAGDCQTGAATVVEAIGGARKAAVAINQYLNGEPVIGLAEPFNVARGKSVKEVDPAYLGEREKLAKAEIPTLSAEKRKSNFLEYELGFSAEAAKNEAMRCLSCSCLDVNTCKLRKYSTDFKADLNKLGTGEYQHPILTDHPFITRDPNKCILCANCVRICNEVMDVTALGLVNRGSETVVLPTLMKPLAETKCESCGQCISTCPTGALLNKPGLSKPGPFITEAVASACVNCSIGCEINVNVIGNQVVEITSPINSINDGNLCKKGTFAYSDIYSADRLTSPKVAKNGALADVGWDEALKAAAQTLQEVKGSAAVLVSPKYTNEEISLAAKLGSTLGGAFGTVPVANGAILKTNGKSASYDDIVNSNLIVAVNVDLAADFPIVAQKVRKALGRGVKLALVGTGNDKFASLASNKFASAGDAKELGSMVKDAGNAVVLVSADSISKADLDLVNGLAGAKVIALSAAGNIKGQLDAGIKVEAGDYDKLLADINSGAVKGLLILGDTSEIDARLFKNGVKTVVVATAAGNVPAQASVVLPGATFIESLGSFVNSEGRVRKAVQAIMPPSGKDNQQILKELAASLS